MAPEQTQQPRFAGRAAPATVRPERRAPRRLSAPMRRAVLYVHIVAAVGWLGIAAVTLVLTAAALTEADAKVAHAAYGFHELLIGTLARPAALITLASGLILAVGSKWGIAKHYWPLAKLTLVVATIATTAALSPGWITLAMQSAGTAPPATEATAAQTNLIGMAVFHILTIGAAVWLAIYKPGGRTRWSSRTKD